MLPSYGRRRIFTSPYRFFTSVTELLFYLLIFVHFYYLYFSIGLYVLWAVAPGQLESPVFYKSIIAMVRAVERATLLHTNTLIFCLKLKNFIVAKLRKQRHEKLHRQGRIYEDEYTYIYKCTGMY